MQTLNNYPKTNWQSNYHYPYHDLQVYTMYVMKWLTKCFAHHSGPLSVPGLTATTASINATYQVQKSDDATTRVITGFETIHFGVPMIGEYGNTGRGRRVTISPAVPGAQYRITAWALDSSTRSATPAVMYATKTEASELHSLCIATCISSHSSKVCSAICLSVTHKKTYQISRV